MKGIIKKFKKSIIGLGLLIMVGCFLIPTNAHGYTTGSTASSNSVDSSGGTYFEIQGGPNGNSRIKLQFKRKSGATTFNNMKYNPSTWTVKIYSGTNNHKIQLDSTTITTKPDVNGEYFILNIPISYEMPAYYKYNSMVRDYPANGARYHLGYYVQSGDNLVNSAQDTGKAQSSTSRRKVNLQLNSCYLGLRTYKKVWYYNCTIGFKIWRQQYNITYHANGGSGSMAGQTIDYGFSQNLRPNTFTRGGYSFVNWKAYRTYDNTWCWKDANGKAVWKAGQPPDSQAYQYKNGGSVASSTPSGTLQLHAMWSPNTYYVTYNANGGSGAPPTQAFTFNSGAKISSTAPTRTGYTFAGWDYNGNHFNPGQAIPSGWGSFTLTAKWNINSYTNTIAHWTWGFKNGEGNNGSKNAFHLGDTSFAANYGSSYTMNTSRGLTPPKGFYLQSSFGTSAISGSWGSYNMGTTVTQKPNGMSFEYDYSPYTYNITYNMNGGTNHTSNPTTYTVLYGVTLQTPTKPGWVFNGWEMNGKKVSGINPGATAKFANATDMRNQLNSRTIGNVTLTATWLPIPEINIPILTNPDNNPIKPFMSDGKLVIQLGDTFTPLKYATATDKIDGDITSKVVVESNGVPMQDGKAIQSGEYKVVYKVTNTSGISSTATLTVIVNQPPTITGPNVRHKLVHEKVDEAFLLGQQSAEDKEDKNITPKLGVKMIKDEMGNIIDKAEDIDTRYVANYEVTISVTDKYKKTVDKTYTLKIVKDDYKYTESHDTDFRFINEKYKDTLSGDSSFSINGGLHEILTNSLGKTRDMAQRIVKYTTDEINSVKSFQNSVKNETRSHMNSMFANLFSNK